MPLENVYDGVAIGNDIALKVPGAAELILKQKCVRAGGLAVDPVVSAHNRFCLAFGDGRAKCGQVGIFHVVLRYLHIDAVTTWLRSAMHGEMFRRGDHPKIFRIVALQAGYECHSHPSG